MTKSGFENIVAKLNSDSGFQAVADSPSDFNLACGADFDWDGKPIRCEDINECVSAPCLNGGACHDSATPGDVVAVLVYTCRCAAGYAGDNCETMVDLACEDSACGHGHCGAGGRCACDDGWGAAAHSRGSLPCLCGCDPLTVYLCVYVYQVGSTVSRTTRAIRR